ncbi:MAG: ankyrin repeat domain-containing protein [Verrucomicrobiota bacterium]|nr:ankyrin repeat domain-containing protein [Verrucomicrobiota bacterium]
MRFPNIQTVLGSLALGALIVYTMRLPEPLKMKAPSAIVGAVPAPPAAESMLIAGPSIGETQLPVVPARRSYRIENCFSTDTDLSAPIVRGKNAVITSALKEEWEIVRKLIDAGAPVESANESGLTALMVAAQHGNTEMLRTLLERQARIDFMDFEGRTAIHYAMAAGKREAVDLLVLYAPSFDGASPAARELLTAALASGDMAIFQTILERFPPTLEWTADTRRALEAALSYGMKEQVRLLLSKHPAPPTREGGTVPLIAYAIASDDARMFKTLLACGSDPNLAIPKTAEKEFTALIKSKYLRNYVQEDGVNLLMLAAGLGKADYVRALLDAGADRNRHTPHEKMLPLYFAAWTENWQCVQMLLGGGPEPEQLRVEISLAQQHASVIKDGITVFTTKVSTGRDGFTTKPGYYVITDKDRDHRSTIYKCPMPYFMRLSCRDFGLHEGVVQPYPASHGCIRLPGDAARKLFVDLPIGTVVSIN